MNASGPQAPLRDFKAASLAEQYIRGWHAHIVESDFAVSMRRVVITKDSQHSLDFDSRSIHRHQNHRLLQMSGSGTIRLTHENRDLAARITRSRRPPLPSIDDVFVAVPKNTRLDVGRIRRGDAWFGHRIT